MIRKSLVFTIIIFVFLLVFQFGINYLKTEHSIDYILSLDNEDFIVSEMYDKSNTFDYYLIDVEHNDVHFLFDIDNIFNKQKQIVKDINLHIIEDLECMSLVYINNENSDLLCSKENKLYSYVALQNEYDFSSIASSKIIENNGNIATDKNDFVLNDDYTYDDEVYLVYNYSNILKYTDDLHIDRLVFSSNDTYDNNFGALLGDYYVLPRLTRSSEIGYYYVFNVFDSTVFELASPVSLSKKLKNLGIYDNKLYVYDLEKQNEIVIDPYSRNIEHIGNKDKGGIIYKNGKEQKISIEELGNLQGEFEFIDDRYESIDYDKIFVLEKYAIYIKGNDFYKVYLNNLDNPIHLFSESDFKEVKVKNDRIYYLKNNTLYRYDDNGIYPIVVRESFIKNPLNSYDVYLSK